MKFISLLFLILVLVGCTSMSTPPPPVLTITTVNLPAATVGGIYAQQLQVTGGVAPYTWSVVAGALPAGVILSSSGVLSGIPSSSGPFNFTVQVTDSVASPAAIQIRGAVQ